MTRTLSSSPWKSSEQFGISGRIHEGNQSRISQFGISGRIHKGNQSRISHNLESLEGFTEEITQGHHSLESLEGYRSMLNLHVILVGLADHARLVNTHIPSLD